MWLHNACGLHMQLKKKIGLYQLRHIQIDLKPYLFVDQIIIVLKENRKNFSTL